MRKIIYDIMVDAGWLNATEIAWLISLALLLITEEELNQELRL